MVTRAGVAKRLGLSIASVRRMEGRELHPWTDERGVHQFDSTEVDEVARASRDAGDRDNDNDIPPFADADRSAPQHRLERELSKAREALHAAAGRAAQLESQTEEMRTMAVEALELLSTLLGSDVPYAVRHALRRLQRHG
jgi:hypothetical protein